MKVTEAERGEILRQIKRELRTNPCKRLRDELDHWERS